MNPIPHERKLRVALLGAGVISAPHIEALEGLKAEVEVAGVCDLDELKARAIQQQHGIPEFFTDLDSMLQRVRPDVVHVMLPPVAHASAAERCLEAGAHVFVEKPFCISSAECLRVEAAAAQAGRVIGVNHNLTFMPSVLEVIEAVRDWRLGELEHVTVIYHLPAPGLANGPHDHWMFAGTGNLMMELGPHPVSVICRFLGRVTSASTQVSGELQLTNGTRFFRNWQSSMVCERGTAQMVLTLGGGFVSTSVHVIGQDGEAFADLRRNTVSFSENSRFLRTANLVDSLEKGFGLIRQGVNNFTNYALAAVKLRPPFLMQTLSMNSSIQTFYRALRAGRNPVIGSREGTAVVQGCERVSESALESVAIHGVEHAALR